MNIDELKNMVSKDMAIDDTELDVESTKTPQLHSKYLNFHHDSRLVLRKLEMDYNVLKKLKWEYYNGKLDLDQLTHLGWEPFQHKILRQDLDLYLNADSDLLELKSKVELQKERVSFLEATLKSISNRQWTIRNAIEWKKFINGTV